MSAKLLLALAVGLVAAASTSCTDPVRDAAVAELGPEDPNVPVGPDHRPGQPCLVCHSENGVASGSSMAVAGTVYTDKDGKKGLAGVEVSFVDARNGGPIEKIVTSASGNFYVPVAKWPPEVSYPFRVAIVKNGKVLEAMAGTVNREGSCNYCHRPPDAPSSLSPEERRRRFYLPVYASELP